MSAATRHGESRHKGKREHFDLPIPATPTLAAEVASDRIPELQGEIERLRAALWARLTIRGRSPKPAADRNGECES